MVQITYTNIEKLTERLDDLNGAKDVLAAQLGELMDTTKLSKKGFKRVLQALALFPKPPAKKFVDSEEITIFMLSTKLRETQLLMVMIMSELNNLQEDSTTESKTGDSNGI